MPTKNQPPWEALKLCLLQARKGFQIYPWKFRLTKGQTPNSESYLPPFQL